VKDLVFTSLTPASNFSAASDSLPQPDLTLGDTGASLFAQAIPSIFADSGAPVLHSPELSSATPALTGPSASPPSSPITSGVAASPVGPGSGGSAAALTATLPTVAPSTSGGAIDSAGGVQVDGSTGSADGGGGEAVPLLTAHATASPNAKPNATLASAPYAPAQIQHAYGFNQLSNQGAGQTIYIVDAYNDPRIASDLQTFDAQWGLPNPTLTVHKMSNFVSNSIGWALEESLDVEWAHAVAPQANITLVEATSTSYSALFSAVNWATTNGAHIVSMSWGGSDVSGETSYDSYFNHTGVTYIASSGDSGGVVEYPSASPYVLSVGGTSLNIDTNNNYVSESAWSSGGGGASVGEKEPGYQTSYHISLSGRGTPDVSYNGDPNTGVYVYDTYTYQPGWYAVGGTSAGAPQWAGLIALANQSRSTPLSSNNLTSRTEYNAATGSVYATNYHDVTTGSNGHAAGTGYDLATGLGSPVANTLVPWLISNN
jgi:subtilase family serine protease